MSLPWCHPRCWAELVHNAYVVAYVSIIDTHVCKSLPTSKVFSNVTSRLHSTRPDDESLYSR